MSENAGDTSSNTEIFDAAERNDLEAIKHCIENDKIPVTSINWLDETVAHIAAKNGNLNIVKYILERDPFISTASDTYGNTVLSLAVENGHLDIVKYVVEYHKADILRPFKRFFGRPTAVHLAARSGQMTILKYFVEEKNADVNATNVFKEPLAFSAARYKHHNIVKYLLEEQNADLTATDSNGDNILYMTIKEKDLTLMKYLLDEKKLPIDVNGRNKYGRTLLHLAAFFNEVNFLTYLVEEKHANVNLVDNNGQTPLHRAAHHNLYEACEYLIKQGANIEQKNYSGKSPLEEATDDRLIQYMESALQKRNRRSIPESFASFWITQPMSPGAREISTRSANYLVGCSTRPSC